MFFLDYPNLYCNWRKDIASFFPLEFPNSSLEIIYPEVFFSIQNKYKFDFVFVFTKLITNGNIETKTIFLSHEFQHAYQNINNKQLYYYGCILDHYIDNSVISNGKLPLEYDAEKKSKYVAASLIGENKITRFIEEKLDNDDFPEYLWEILISKDMQKEYSLKNEILKLWEEHKIQENIDLLKNKSDSTEDDKKILEMYDFANS